MTMGELVTAIIVFIFSALFLLLGIKSFFQKGFLLNNAYIFSSKDKREAMNKKPYYKQSAISFCVLSAVFIVIGLSLLFQNDKLLLFEVPLIIGGIIYAVISTVQINKKENK